MKSAKKDRNNRRYDSNFLVIYAERSFLVVVVEGRGGRKKKRGGGGGRKTISDDKYDWVINGGTISGWK